jgi:hypothetical protein
VRRREFITLVGGVAVAWPLAARAQQSERVRRLGALMSGAETDPEMQARLAGFRQGLGRFGWTDERNIHVDYRFAAANMDRAQELARELIALRPDVLVAWATVPAVALQQQNRSIPMVFVGAEDCALCARPNVWPCTCGPLPLPGRGAGFGMICREDLDKRALRQLCCFTFANSISQHALHAL